MKTKKVIALIMLALMLSLPMAHASLEGTTAIMVSFLNQDPDPAIAGDIFDVRIGIENLGGSPATNFAVELSPEYPFELVPGESAVQKIGTMNAYQAGQNMKIVDYRVLADKNAVARSYDLKLNYYGDGLGVIQKSFSINVNSAKSAEVIHIDKTTLVPGNQSSLIFRINNVGNAPLSDLTFSWQNPDKIILPVGSDNTRYIKHLDIGGSADVEYQVIADSNAQAGLYQLNLYLTYDQAANSTPKTVSTIAGVYVGGQTNFDIALSDSSAGTTSFSIANIGSNPANSVSVIIPEQRGWAVGGSNAYMIGNLNKGDYTVATFSLQSPYANATSSSSAGANLQGRGGMEGMGGGANFNSSSRAFNNSAALNATLGALQMQIAYTDTMGVRHIVNKEVSMGAQIRQSFGSATGRASAQSTSIGSQYGNYIAIIAVLAAGFLLYRRYGKRKNGSNAFTTGSFLGKKKN